MERPANTSRDATFEGRPLRRVGEDTMDFSDIERRTAPSVPEEEELSERSLTVEVGGRRFRVKYWAQVLTAPGSGKRVAPRRKAPKLEGSGGSRGGAGEVTAPMQGTIVKIHHKAGDTVQQGEPVCVLEAMKMENEIKAPSSGDIVDTVSAGQLILVIK